MSPDNPSVKNPFLNAALICEKILEEKDSVVSAIRIIDRIFRSPEGPDIPETMEPFNFGFTLYLLFKSGSARGSRQLKVTGIKPSGEKMPSFSQKIHFKGEDDQGIGVSLNIGMKIDLEGLYWFDVELDDVRLTRVPLRVIYTREIKRLGGSDA